jgi:hypothetical protein
MMSTAGRGHGIEALRCNRNNKDQDRKALLSCSTYSFRIKPSTTTPTEQK